MYGEFRIHVNKDAADVVNIGVKHLIKPNSAADAGTALANIYL